MRLPAANPSCCCRGSAEIEVTESSSVLAFCLPSPVASLPRAMLRRFPPMGVYETLFRFAAATHHYMGDPGTHPWAQGFPLTTQIPGGPTLPDSIAIGAGDRMYPKADGQPPLREAIANYYNTFYGSKITPDNVAVFAGGRPAIFAILAFLEKGVRVAIEETEYTPYYDLLEVLGREHTLIASHTGNRFRPTLADHPQGGRVLLIKSNPCNPTGVTLHGDELGKLVAHYSQAGRGALIDEAYEFFHSPKPVSAMEFIKDIDATDLFVVGAATKGLQCPGMRVGWVIAAKHHIELFRNYSSFGMGGVSRASQLYVTQLLTTERVQQARTAIAKFYGDQRQRYGEGLRKLGFELYTGEGGFYHWARLPGSLTGDAFNERLFAHKAGILPGRLCDMARRGEVGPLGRMVRFSFGPLGAESLQDDLAILAKCV
jgi:aminotransferase